jgi:hypothetical protein
VLLGAGAREAVLQPVGCSGLDMSRRECAGSGLVAVRAIGGAWWRSVILPLGWWADRRMQMVHGGEFGWGDTAKYDFI